MALPGKYGKSATTTTTAAKAPAKPAAPKSRYAGVAASAAQYPFPVASSHRYRFRVLDAREGFNPGTGRRSNKVDLEIVEFAGTEQRVGDRVGFVKVGDSAAALGQVKRFVMAATGFEDEASYNEADPEGLFIDAAFGHANEFSELFEGANPIVGRLVDCVVTNEGDDGKGDYYRGYVWTPVPEDEQDQTQGLATALADAG